MAYTYIEGYQGHTLGANGPITRVVMHGTVSGTHKGGAREVARYFRSANSGGLAHYVVDPSEIIQCCKESVSCWHAPPNKGSIGVELCDPQSGSDSRWGDKDHTAMLHLAAGLVRDICTRNSVPMVFVDANGLKQGKHGITTHAEVSKAFKQSDHTDPGAGFPMANFMTLVNNHPPHPPTSKPASPSPKQYPTMRQGATGTGVSRLQSLLHIKVDGSYGPQTTAAVKAYQQSHGLSADGVAGPQTLKKIGW